MCVCDAGYTGEDGGTCEACPLSTYKTSTESTSCLNCLLNSGHALTGQLDLSSCLCNSGYTGSNGGTCSPCTSGSYKSSVGSLSCTFCAADHYGTSDAAVDLSSCVACPTNSLSQAGSSRIELCVCVAGFKQTVMHDACIECSQGYYDDTTDRYESGPAAQSPEPHGPLAVDYEVN